MNTKLETQKACPQNGNMAMLKQTPKELALITLRSLPEDSTYEELIQAVQDLKEEGYCNDDLIDSLARPETLSVSRKEAEEERAAPTLEISLPQQPPPLPSNSSKEHKG